MKALVQMFTNDIGVQFVAATEADSGGMFWFFLWGDVTGYVYRAYKSVWKCDDAFLLWGADPLTGWRHDGTPVVTNVPCILECEDEAAWAQRATGAMKEHVMALHERTIG